MRRIRRSADLARRYDLAILGAGPAGMAAAAEASALGLDVLVVMPR